MRSVQIGTVEVPLKAPASFAVGRSVIVAMQSNSLLGLGAALGLCWDGKPLRTALKAHGYSVLEYGAAVLDELHGLGVPESDIWSAASVALELLTGAQPTEAGVAAAESFTVPTTASSTP